MVRSQRRLLVGVLALTAAFLPLDLIFGATQTPGLVASRVLLFAGFGGVALVLPKLGERGRTVALTGLGVLSPIAVALMCWGTGGTTSPAFSFMWALPMLVGMVCLEEPTADLAATLGTAIAGTALLASEGRVGPPLFYFLMVTFSGGALATVSTWLRRKNHRAELHRVRETDAEHHRTEAALETAQQRLAQADRISSLGTLAGGVAHQINNPLAFIVANVSFVTEQLAARKDPALQELCDALADAQHGALRVRDIVRDLKVFANMQDERLERVAVGKCLETALMLSDNQLRHRAKVVRELGEVPEVIANAPLLVQVFVNLLTNAAQAIADGHADANTITVRTGVDSDGRVAVSVTDTGVGIAPAVLPRIFEPFFTTKPQGVGVGLGLSICHGIVKKLGGELTVETTEGKGSTFSVRLAPAAAQVIEPAPAPIVAPPVPSRQLVLVIDDDEMVGKSVKRMLERHYEVRLFTAARDALTWLGHGEPCDVIVCDVMMPVMGGVEFLAALTQQRPALAERVVFATGGAFTETSQGLVASARVCLEKPFMPDVLLSTVRQVMQAKN